MGMHDVNRLSMAMSIAIGYSYRNWKLNGTR